MRLSTCDVLLADKISAMRWQESVSYSCADYLGYLRAEHRLYSTKSCHGHRDDKRESSESNMPSTGMGDSELAKDEDERTSVEDDDSELIKVGREKICEWMFQVADQCDVSREVVEVAMSYLDRFIASLILSSPKFGGERANPNGWVFQLASLTAVYLAIKLHDPRNVRVDRFAGLSRGHFTSSDITAMEQTMLSSLSWLVHPPTSVGFLNMLKELLPPPTACDPDVNANIFELARFFAELSVWEYTFVAQKSSTIALGSLLNAMEMMGPKRFPFSARETFFHNLGTTAPGLFDDPEKAEMDVVRKKLNEIFAQSAECSTDKSHSTFLAEVSADGSREASSPVCVSGINI